MARSTALILLFLSLVAAWGCRAFDSTGDPSPATIATSSPSLDLGDGEQLVALYELTINPTHPSAVVKPVASRASAGFQASMYDLDLSTFRKPAQFRVTHVDWTARGDVRVRFAHAHPFSAPDLTQPPTAQNRADLSYTGRLLLLADLPAAQVAEHTFFGTVIAHTRLLQNADGFVQPGPLLAEGGFNANAFPYVLLKDEWPTTEIDDPDPPEAPRGNYDPSIGGWQRENLGPAGTGWSGYDFIHAGQESTGQLILDRDAFETSSVTIPVALLIKYTEPKGVGGGEGRALRLPPEPVDITQFAYRLPHAALDCSTVRFEWNRYDEVARDLIHIDQAAGSTAQLEFTIRDWDAQAEEAFQDDISLSPFVYQVEPGASGPPSVEADVPGLMVNPMQANLLDATRSGLPGREDQELPYSVTITNEAGIAAISDWPGLLRVIDREALTQPPGSPHYGLDPGTLTPLPSGELAPITYQGFTMRVIPPLPTWNVHVVDPDLITGEWPDVGIIENGSGPADDRIAIAYFNRSTAWLKCAISSRPDPMSTADWTTHVVDSSGSVGWGTSMTPHNGALWISYFDRTAEVLKLARSTIPAPASMADWSISLIDDETGNEPDHWWQTILEPAPDGTLMTAFSQAIPALPSGEIDRKLIFAYATTALPSSPSEWVQHAVACIEDGDSTENSYSYEVRLRFLGDLPTVLFTEKPGCFIGPGDERARLILITARNAHPERTEDWLRSPLFSTLESIPPWVSSTLDLIDNQWCIHTQQFFRVGEASATQPTAPWLTHLADLPGNNPNDSLSFGPSSITLNERVTVVGAQSIDPDQNMAAVRGLIALPRRAEDWQASEIYPERQWAAGRYDSDIVIYQDRYAVAFVGLDNLMFAWNQEVW